MKLFSKQDERFMRRALALARRGIGKTSPNPVVGAVIIRAGRIVGEGYHQFAGGPHAEVAALLDTRQPARATLYVTLEPCCTFGRTPPCTDAIIRAGISRVVVAATDPNPKHRGRGLRLLRKAGIEVEAGLLAEEATRLNAAFNHWITTGRPLVTTKAALSLDGKMATQTGDSKWITSDAARTEAHRLRARMDAVMVGANTVIRDDPQLTLRHGVRGRQPWRVVVDSRGRCPTTAKLFTDKHRQHTIVLTTDKSSSRWRRYLEVLGIHVAVVRAKNGRVDMEAGLRQLGRREITSVLIEGGATLLGAAFDTGLVDKVAYVFAPKVIAGSARVAQATLVRGQWRPVGKGEMMFEGDVVR